MSPDIEWRVGEETEQETIARVTSGKPSRWRKPIMLLAAALGIGLGLLYASIPEPARPIAPTIPVATSLPPAPPLEWTVDREARALSNGDMQTFIGLLDPDDYRWRQDQISSFTPWGTPLSSGEFYRIIATDRPDAQHAWADVLQYRSGKFFRETRFYRLRDGAWVRTRPVSDPAWWGDEKTIATRYFQITYLAADDALSHLLASYLSRESRETCRTFSCRSDEQPPVVHFILRPDATFYQPRVERSESTFTVTLPSPRLAGYYSTDFSGVNVADDRWTQYYDRYLYFPLLYTAIGGLDRWSQNRDGLMYLYAVGFWDLNRRGRSSVGRWQFPFSPELVTDMLALSSDTLWDWPADASKASVQVRLANASALVQFIDETYGEEMVLRFFHTLRSAQSLAQAIDGLGVPYSEFDAKWLEWSNRAATNKPKVSN